MNYNTWNDMYQQGWEQEPQTFSRKWGWHYSTNPFVKLPTYTQNRPYKRGGPNTYSQMYRRQYAVVSYSGFVNNMGDL